MTADIAKRDADETGGCLLDVDGLWIGFRGEAGDVTVVRDVSFCIRAGETVALVGESGCGKSVTALSLARLLPEPAAYYSAGRIELDGRRVLELKRRELRKLRGGVIAYVFQDPGTALNPVFKVGFQLVEALREHQPEVDAQAEAVRLLDMVGLPDAAACMRVYPYELSGGMQQRVVIAMALACKPKLLVADEPTTALDVTIQAQIMELLKRLQVEFGMAILLITHNLGLVADVADRVNVMYAGSLVESGPVEEVLRHPYHPYTVGRLRAVPRRDMSGERMSGIDGSVPMPGDWPEGCTFAPRCDKAGKICEAGLPEFVEMDGGRGVRCCLVKPAGKAGADE
jgi:oligopeptide/dipeptide ABC transporter ATP-binding protein